MTFTTVGFTGTVDAAQDARRSQFIGALFPVVGTRNSLAVSINGAAILTCTVPGGGTSWAHGVMATLDATDSVVFDPVTTSGAIRWDAVVIRRTWASSTAELVVVKGAAAANAPQVLPSGLNNSPGVLHDHVLALVRITNGQNLPTMIVDLRMWATKVFTVGSVAALPPANNALYGAEAVLVDGTRYRCILDDSNNMAWVAAGQDVVELLGTAVLEPLTGWTVPAPLVNRCLKGAHSRDLDLEFRRTGGTINSDDATGDAPNTPIAQLKVACRPDRDLTVPFSYRFGADDSNIGGGTAALTAGGLLTLYAFDQPGMNLVNATTTGEVSLRISLHFGTKGV